MPTDTTTISTTDTTTTDTTSRERPRRVDGEHRDDGTIGVAGVNHVAIVTDDLERIARFYTEVFDGARVDVPAPPGAEVAAVVRLGPRAGIAFVQAAGHPFAPGSTQELTRGHLDHLALDASSLASLERARDRLVARGASDGRIRDYGPMLCVTFTDPDGMGSEICWLRDPSLAGLHPPVLSDPASPSEKIVG